MSGVPAIADLDAWLAQREATVPALRPHCAKRIIWAEQIGARTDDVVVYIHGFSATGQEVRPLPDLVAKGLGANLYLARLSGHGQDGPALGAATLEQWRADLAEALEVAATLGRRVIAMGCSTGCTLLTEAVAKGAKVDALVFLSPNFGLTHPLAYHLLKLPMVRKWGHLIAGRERSFPAISEDHAAYWTLRYPTQAVYTMGEAVAAVRAVDLRGGTAPILVELNPKDQVVSARRTRRTLQGWGGTVTIDELIQTPRDDEMGHIMAGDIFSPNQTEPLAARILAWLAENR